jgi:hypothetical protein
MAASFEQGRVVDSAALRFDLDQAGRRCSAAMVRIEGSGFQNSSV